MNELPWFERELIFGKPKEMLPYYLERLRGTPIRIEEKLIGIPEYVLSKQHNTKWSVKQNIGHLAEVDEVAMRRIDEMVSGISPLSPAVFEPKQDYNSMPIKEVIDYFKKSRTKNLEKYSNLKEDELLKNSLHPRLKVTMTPVDLAWFDAEHDDHHLVKIHEIISTLKKKQCFMKILTSSVPVQRITKSRISKVDFTNLEFGKYIADHMLVAEFSNGRWHSPEVKPYGEIMMSPAILSLHYGQSVFEGMKAFKMQDGNVSIFRIIKHHERFTKSLARMCMPTIPEDFFVNSLHALIETDHAWVPSSDGASLYIRPLVFATEAKLGVKVSEEYKFIIMTSPVGPYFNKPIRVKVEEKYVRAAEGGSGYAKCAGNYGGAFYPTQLAREQGFDQVLWTDGKEHKYIDESGAMNVMFVLDGKLVTPKLTSAILDGVTRDSILTLAEDLGLPHEERKISISDLEEGFAKGTLTEAFGVGTAAVVAPIKEINIHGKDYQLPDVQHSSFQVQVKNKLAAIRTGSDIDTHNWNYIVSLP